jgi:hypothetical protein
MSLSLIEQLVPHNRASGRLPLLPWIKRAEIMLRGTTPYSFKGHEYLRQIIEDAHPDQTFEKGAQVGISTAVLIKALYVAEHLGKKALYFFQNDQAVQDFSNERAQPMIESSRYLRARIGSTCNVGLKQIGSGAVFFRGMVNKGKVKSTDGDFIILDELDEARQENKEFALDRIMHSDLQWVHALSQPSEPGFGIDAEFADTDQHYWHLICPSCGHDNCMELNFPDNFLEIPKEKARLFPERATHYRGCVKCKARLQPSQGIWVPHQPSRYRRGYHLSQLYTQVQPPGYPNYATKIMKEYYEAKRAQSKLARFTISIIGFPFAGGNARVHDLLLDAMEAVLQSYGFSYAEPGCFMGVDQGDTLTIIVGMMSGPTFAVVYGEETEDWGRLDFFMQQFGVECCVIDAMPNKHSAKSFATRHPGRVWIQYFGSRDLKKSQELHEGNLLVDVISVDRTETLDGTIDKMEGGLIALPSRAKCEGKALASMEDIRRHLKQLISRQEQMPSGLLKRVYLSGPNVQNHYGMALNNACLAAFELGIAPSPMVLPVFGMGYA